MSTTTIAVLPLTNPNQDANQTQNTASSKSRFLQTLKGFGQKIGGFLLGTTTRWNVAKGVLGAGIFVMMICLIARFAH